MKTRHFCVVVMTAVIMTASAVAADLPSRKDDPLPAPPPPMWTGFYVGLNAGGTWSNSNSANVASAPFWTIPGLNGDVLGASAISASAYNPANTGGFIGGGQIGYNWRIAGSFVTGIEADIQGIAGNGGAGSSANVAAIAGALVPTHVATVVGTSKSLDYLGTVRGRIGYLATPTLLIYGTGGLAYGGVSSSTTIWQSASFIDTTVPWGSTGAFSDTRVGWAAGGGIEWMFMSNWSAKVEYLYYDLGSVTYNSSPLVVTSTLFGAETASLPSTRVRFNGNIVRAGLNYHFNWGSAPVIAQY
ncbi:outer membrane beta-barrel protein [Methylocystis sp. WRRC1]|uniref:outer membrane protein n=1 Tax=Methylocystis sp. WRRC1 TaxID=1732014 RepID=UPI001D141760|nr:outer membrane beta-barrel protein [Methylocystis sp. WRRC1]MCC3243747.1 outer membrane beta-barrel protein [Methylocystis sp. WRRC1]